MPARETARVARPTMKAIAQRAGVSRATVSIILSQRQDVAARFKPETVIRVRQIAQEMGYQANLMAVSLRNPHPAFFGLIMRGIGEEDAISWHHQAFEGQFQAGVIQAAHGERLYPVVATQDAAETNAVLERMRGMLDGGVLGAILRTPLPELAALIRDRIDRGFPAVIVFPDRSIACPSNSIDMDNLAAGRIAAGLLHNAGRSRWVVVRDEVPREALRLREDGVLAVAAEAGASVESLTVPSGIDETVTREWLAPRLRHLRPDGIYAASSITGVGTLLACLAAGLRVPEDVCLVGCDASLWRAPGCPGITSVDVSWFSAGALAVRKMVELRERGEAFFENINLPPLVRKGETCPGGEQEPPRVIPC